MPKSFHHENYTFFCSVVIALLCFVILGKLPVTPVQCGKFCCRSVSGSVQTVAEFQGM